MLRFFMSSQAGFTRGELQQMDDQVAQILEACPTYRKAVDAAMDAVKETHRHVQRGALSTETARKIRHDEFHKRFYGNKTGAV